MRKTHGFTLIELMIVCAIIGILAAVAFPAYQTQVRKSNRANAQALMMDAVNKQAFYLSAQRTYATSLTDLNIVPASDISKFYTFEIAVVDGTPPTFTITGKVKSGTAQTPDGDISLDNKGVKTPANKW